MPTYQNRSGEKVFVNNTSFSPGETKALSYYINLNDAPNIYKIDDDPTMIKDFRSIITNSGPSDFTPIRTLEHSYVLKVTDGANAPTAGSTATVGFFVGNTDNPMDFVLVKKYEFQKEVYGSYSYWYTKDNILVPRQNIDTTLEFFMFRILSVSNGSINLLLKYY